MSEVMENQDVLQAAFERLQAGPDRGPAWLGELRETAMTRFQEVGWPTLEDEEWRFTSVKELVETPFGAAQRGGTMTVPPEHRMAAAAVELVFVDGFYRQELSQLGNAGAGVRVMSLKEALEQEPVLVRAHLARHADLRSDAFTALNTAMIEDGAFVHIPAGATLAGPIHLLLLSTGGPRPVASHPRTLIVAEEGSKGVVIEDYLALADGVYWSNAVTEIVVGAGADIQHYLLEQDSEQAFNIETLRVTQKAGSRFESHTALFGGNLVRNNVHVELAGDDCRSLVNGLFVGHGRQHMDNHMRVVHGGLRGDSRQFYKGILDDRAHGVFSGRIVVRPGAQKTYAKQTSRNLLLSDDAQIDTRPQLEIYADDVKCTHGSTTGRLDEAAAFYLQTRGISAEAARGLLTYAFAHESLERMALPGIRSRLERLLVARLPQAELLETLIDLPRAN